MVQFTLDCVEKICEAATWVSHIFTPAQKSDALLTRNQVWEKIKVGWQKLKDFVGFIFNWEDIKETKNTISTLITASIGAACDKVGDIEKKVDSFFDNLDKKIDQFGPVGPQKIMANQNGKSQRTESNGTSASWTQERLKNGGATSSTQLDKGKRQPSYRDSD